MTAAKDRAHLELISWADQAPRPPFRDFDFSAVNPKPSPGDIKAACEMAWQLVLGFGLDTLERCKVKT